MLNFCLWKIDTGAGSGTGSILLILKDLDPDKKRMHPVVKKLKDIYILGQKILFLGPRQTCNFVGVKPHSLQKRQQITMPRSWPCWYALTF